MAPPMPAPWLIPSPSESALKLHYVGQKLKDCQVPAAVLDVAAIRRNCKAMLDCVNALGVFFRAHVKTHKTTQLTRYQVGEDSKDVRLIASTVAEIEQLVPFLLECKAKGKNVNILYGLPIAPSHIPRLGAVTRILGQGTVALFVDNPEHLRILSQLDDVVWPGKVPVMAKIAAEVPFRAGLSHDSKTLSQLSEIISASPKVELKGAYAHMGSSYGSGSPAEALDYLMQEVKAVQAGAEMLTRSMQPSTEKLLVSLGATPTITSAQNILEDNEWNRKFRAYLDEVKQNFDVEFHAGVYPVLDMQQMAARARPAESMNRPLLAYENLGLRIMVEVASVYTERGQPEALVGAGSIVLGREPCKSYPGWGVVTPWLEDKPSGDAQFYDPEGSKTGWIVGRISQEHGTLLWQGSQEAMRELKIGEKLMVWPNHACMAGPNFGYYLVVDSDSSDKDIVRDVWIRWRGW
ncbi:hypothetical protein AAFC00_006684 [Neodothiora populina]|uniref:D-serine dehydratase-like domain-containing protein n=1 Tax=Neodothiora populina TaxID=2781224 RepID=A0ABR3PB37_9PEZI